MEKAQGPMRKTTRGNQKKGERGRQHSRGERREEGSGVCVPLTAGPHQVHAARHGVYPHVGPTDASGGWWCGVGVEGPGPSGEWPAGAARGLAWPGAALVLAWARALSAACADTRVWDAGWWGPGAREPTWK